MIKVKIKFDQIDQKALFQGKSGRYLDLVLWENKDGKSQYGDDFTVKQDLGKERRGEKAPIIGNARWGGTVQPSRPAPADDRGESTTVWNRPPAGGASGVNAPGGETEDIPFAPWTL